MWPLATAKLGLRYLRSNFSERLGHPLKNPLRTAFRSVEMLGLHRDWWAYLMALARVCTECMKVARVTPGWTLLASIGRCGAPLKQGPGCGRAVGPGVVHTLLRIGSVHRLVVGSLYPRKITFSFNITSHFSLLKMTVHPALHKGQIPMRDAIAKDGTMCPVSTVGSPGMLMSQMCVFVALFPSGKLFVRGFFATCLFATLAPSMIKIDVAPESAIAI